LSLHIPGACSGGASDLGAVKEHPRDVVTRCGLCTDPRRRGGDTLAGGVDDGKARDVKAKGGGGFALLGAKDAQHLVDAI
jgi:hypothetical protein